MHGILAFRETQITFSHAFNGCVGHGIRINEFLTSKSLTNEDLATKFINIALIWILSNAK